MLFSFFLIVTIDDVLMNHHEIYYYWRQRELIRIFALTFFLLAFFWIILRFWKQKLN